jgi:DNA-binding PadR family transcriptional regulator/energy-coupling factor transporter ATP-binding protein EcfA2
MELRKSGEEYIASGTLKFTGVSELRYENILRGVHGGGLECSLLIETGKSCNTYLTVFGKDKSEKRAAQIIQYKEDTFKNLFRGCNIISSPIPQILRKKCSALIFILGKPGDNSKLSCSGLIDSLSSINMHFCLNIHPIDVDTDMKDDVKESSKTLNQLKSENIDRTLEIHRDCRFWVTYAVLVQTEDLVELGKHVEVIKSNIGSVYDSEGSELKLLIFWHDEAVKFAQRLFQGERLYATLLPMSELLSYFQIPHAYGIENLRRVEFEVPAFQGKGLDIGNILGHSGEELYPAVIDPDSLYEHIAVWGATGTGKSTLIKNLIIKLHNDYGLKLLIFDFHNEYRNIISKLNGELGKDILVLNPFINPFSINPLELPDLKDTDKEIAIVERTENFISLINQMFILGEVQEGRLRDALYQLYKEDNPLISNLIRKLYFYKSVALAGKLKKFTTGFYGQIFNQTSSSLSLEQIEKTTTIIELGRIPSELRTFFVNVFLIQWWDYRRTRKQDEIKPHILVLDEFSNYSGFIVVRKMLSEARKFHQALICACQGPNQIRDEDILEDVVRNTATKIVFRQDQGTDKRTVGTAFGGLPLEQYNYLSMMDVGEAIVKLKNMKHVFRVRTYLLPELGSVTDEQIMNSVPREELKSETVLTEALSDSQSDNEQDYESRFLQVLAEKGPLSAAEVIKELHIQKRRGFILKDKLKENGLLVEEQVRKGRGRPSLVLKLTDAGYEALGIRKKTTAPQHGGEEHNQIKGKVSEVLRDAGWDVKVEFKGCDVAAFKDGRKIAVEVETGKHKSPDQMLKNIRRDLEWVDMVFIACPNNEFKADLEKEINEFGQIQLRLLTYEEIGQLPDICLKENGSD